MSVVVVELMAIVRFIYPEGSIGAATSMYNIYIYIYI